MARINVLADDIELGAPMLVEGLPGVGLVGKIAADHLVDTFEMTHYANVHCEGIPRVVTYGEGAGELTTPVRLYADETHDLLVLQSDVPIHPESGTQLASCLASWFSDVDVTPIYLSGLPREKDDTPPTLYGVAAGSGLSLLSEAGIDEPAEMGLVSGPTGAMLAHAVEHETTAVGLIVESDPKFPDPESARIILQEGIEPLTEIEIPVDALVDHASDIQEAKERLARQMQDATEESTQARPLRMYQ